MSEKRIAYLYCTIYNEIWLVGTVENEGDMEELLGKHCQQNGQDHKKHVHLCVEGTPLHDELKEIPGFPHWFNADKELEEKFPVIIPVADGIYGEGYSRAVSVINGVQRSNNNAKMFQEASIQ